MLEDLTNDDELGINILVSMFRSRTVNQRKIAKTQNISKPQLEKYQLKGAKILRDWLLKNLNNPYPSDEQYEKFKNETKLTDTQLKNWFANARRRWPQLKGKKLSRKAKKIVM